MLGVNNGKANIFLILNYRQQTDQNGKTMKCTKTGTQCYIFAQYLGTKVKPSSGAKRKNVIKKEKDYYK